ncbi:MAG: CPBP family intramembrane metalloprotease [Blastochloris sp.]|nr:CPBP family intramembrane metalloprotease [Blastochloris sp.]
MHAGTPTRRSPWRFLAFVGALSTPFWVLGAGTRRRWMTTLPFNLPPSALMFVTPLLAALLLTGTEAGRPGIHRLIQRSLDWRSIRPRIWYAPIIGGPPLLIGASYLLTQIQGRPHPVVDWSVRKALVLTSVFAVAAYTEEIGWQGYVAEAFQEQHSAVVTGMIVGGAWAVWHIVPYLQAQRSPRWIIWQCIATIGLRVLMVVIAKRTGQSIPAATLFHLMINLSIAHPSVRRARFRTVTQLDHAGGEGLHPDERQAQARRARNEERRTATQHHRIECQAVLINQAGAREGCNQATAAEDQDVAARVRLQGGDGLRHPVPDDLGLRPRARRERRRDDHFPHRVESPRQFTLLLGPERGETLIGTPAEQQRVGSVQ